VSHYRDPRLALSWAHKDAQDLAAAFSRAGESFASSHDASVRPGLFRTVHAWSFVDEAVTPEAIRAAKGLLAAAAPDDVFVLFVAGHGVHDRDPDSTYYYLGWGADIADLSATAADFELIEDLLDGIAPRAKLLLMDTCESGEADVSADPVAAAASPGSRGITARAVRGLTTVTVAAPTAPAAGQKRPWLQDRDRYIGNDLRRRSGAIVLSSSRGGEFSYERDDIQNGVFTEEILAALTGPRADADRNGIVTTDELRAYVATAVPLQTGDLQHPTVDRDNIFQSFGFPLSARAR